MAEAFNCNNCESQLSAGSSFCGSCGAAVRQSENVVNQDADLTGTSNLLADEEQQSGEIRMTTVRRLGVMSVGKISLVVYGLIAGLIGVFVALFTAGPLTALGLLIGIPIFYGIIGFFGGILTAWIYNLVAGWVGGIKMELR